MRLPGARAWSIACTITAAAVVACNSDSGTGLSALNRVALIAVSLASGRLTIGQTVPATVTLKSASGVTLSGKAITWRSADSSVAAVNSTSGMVTGVSAGSTTITALSDGASGSTNVQVLAPVAVASIEVDLQSPQINIGDSTQAVATPKDAQGNALSGRVIAWTTSDPTVATVDASTGVVTGVGAGSAVISATSESRVGQATILVVTSGSGTPPGGGNPPPPAPVPVASVFVTLGVTSLNVGGTTQATAVARDASGNVLTGRTLVWSSSNPAAATIGGSSGVVTAVGVGVTTIIGIAEGHAGSALLTVTATTPPPSGGGSAPVAAVTVSIASSPISIGASTQGTAITTDASGNVLTGRTITWSSSNTSVATVSSSGAIIGVAVGTVSITATSEGKTGSAALSVTPVPVASVTVGLGASSLVAGTTTQATAIAKDASGNVLTGRTITWVSTNTTVATVSSGGVVTAVAAGTVLIRATSEGQTGSATLTVTPVPVATVTVSMVSDTLAVGATAQAAATTTDASGNVLTGRTITWSSGNSAVATVSSSGKVTAVATGTASITATSEGKSGSVTVTAIVVPVATVSVSLASGSIATGATTQATAITKDANGNVLSGRTITWSSANTAAATVSTSGLVTAVAAGTSAITATSEGKTGSATVTVTAPVVATQLVVATQPSTTALLGVVLSQEPAVQLESAAGAAVAQSGVVVTAAIASGGGTLGGTLTATTNANGLATFTNLSIAGTAGSRTLSFTASGLSAATSNAVNVTALGGPPTSEPEPTFNAALQTMILSDDFDGDATFANAVAGGWQCSNASTTNDVTTNPAGACQIIAPGSQGSAHAIRLVYDGIANAGGQEAHAWGRPITDKLAAMPGHTLYLSYDFRMNPGGGFTLDDAGGGPHIIKVKWLELWNTTDRAQFSTAYQFCYNNVPQKSTSGGGTIWDFYANAGNNTTCQAGQVRPPFAYQMQNQWHRVTYRYVTRSSSTATDGVGQLWVDGTLIVSVNASDCGVTVPGAVNDAATGYPSQPATAENHNPAQWCQTKDLTGFFVAQPVVRLTFGSVSTSTLWPFSIDIDHMRIWRD